MIEDEIRQEIQEEQAEKLEDGEFVFGKEKCENDYQNPKEKCKVGNLFPKKEWDELIHWQPVSNIPVDEIYEGLPEVKRFHDDYCKLWLTKTRDNVK